MKKLLPKTIFILLILAVWQFLFQLNIWPDFLFPSPRMVMITLIEGFKDRTFIFAITASFKRLLIGYSISLLFGLMLGVLIASFQLIEDTIGPFILALQSVPSVVWLPLALLWFSMGEKAIIFVVVLGGTWNMVINASTGIKNVQPVLIKAAKTMGVNKIHLFWKVILPAAVPHLITGMRLSWAFSWRALMAGELIGSGDGLGQILMWGRDMGNMSLVITVILLIGSIGYLTDNFLFKKAETIVLNRWGLNSK
ncbi:MAG: nitrate/sulfonate/bicarbonate ABC transporter permease [Halanaerobium sp. 4-GBenrich]|jgi:NitT/TauT family transport system permease protein|uniref:NitT/TauT family transport system permease protein n=1 Tax=Halanaerobium congolense TaxID=54121 RepID=A0A1G6RNZ4_9FIRM|nr:ABC transporter permease [Halanaerobium congolense]ODS50850.1 MAG: nitrate/sulfonate/bicarbonate ABC transporter permease [Halanaerobium sp. 4-GBenrich]OEG61952.1 MAG: ABC transporter permease [Halanaerobium sp. MDAL1]PUU93235.1 MAG: nitrate/sulfonate/bicarbonate ABC transporter permease [Halanaerobium sp.]PTX17769.1 NitT/TauT family transport system permease protein [Halanaerobium congolense]TDS28231.1 NitT/TauT family transport system permease protein [Halanaerobium congolense]